MIPKEFVDYVAEPNCAFKFITVLYIIKCSVFIVSLYFQCEIVTISRFFQFHIECCIKSVFRQGVQHLVSPIHHLEIRMVSFILREHYIPASILITFKTKFHLFYLFELVLIIGYTIRLK